MPAMCNAHDTNTALESFETEAAAADWMYEAVDDPCVDNYRFAYEDDAEAVAKFDEARDDGCCGSFNCHVIVGGRKAIIGCNYGH